MGVIEVQLHTLAPQKLIELKRNLDESKLDRVKELIAKQLKALTIDRFMTQTDPWGGRWIPSQRIVSQGKKIERYEAAKRRYPETKRRYDERHARWVAAGRKGREPKAPREPKQPMDRSSPLTMAGQTLVDTTRLRDSFEVMKKGGEVVLTQKDNSGQARFGAPGAVSNLVYFPTHQWGLPAKNIPARPMLPIRGNAIDLPETYRTAVMNTVKTWLRRYVT
ncbi:MAG: hypothetical protein LBT40_12270 [Deltaproteobacteria bacterium]|jgi:hypothetical protein|nr:hypothetical protein [Deltaproteobacteria bacterium]